MLAENNTAIRKFLTNRNILTEELQNAAILKDLVQSVSGNNKLDENYKEIVALLADKVLESLKDDPIIEVKVPARLIDEIRKELKKSDTVIYETPKGIKKELRKGCI